MDDEAMKMAIRIGERNTGTFTVHPEHGVRHLDEGTVSLIRQTAINAALAAIIETRDRDAALADAEVAKHSTGSGFDSQPARVAANNIAAAIRSGQQFRRGV